MIKPSPSHSGDDLDPGVRDFIRLTGEAYVTHRNGLGTTPRDNRLVAEKVREPWVKGGPIMHATSEYSVVSPHGLVRIRLYNPTADSAPKPALIYVHGGGFVMFSIDTHDRIMREYAARAGICVIGIDYSLSPEARFPVALDEVVAVVRHVRDNAADFNIDPERIALGGDSAGANLSLSTALVLRDAGEDDTLSTLVFNYGAFGTELSPDDVRNYGGPAYMLTADEMAYFWTQYLASPADAENPLAVPLLANLHGLPSVFLAVPQCDVLTSQSLQLNEKLRASGVPAQTVVYQGASHSFLEAVSISQVAEQAFIDTANWLKTELGLDRSAATS